MTGNLSGSLIPNPDEVAADNLFAMNRPENDVLADNLLAGKRDALDVLLEKWRGNATKEYVFKGVLGAPDIPGPMMVHNPTMILQREAAADVLRALLASGWGSQVIADIMIPDWLARLEREK